MDRNVFITLKAVVAIGVAVVATVILVISIVAAVAIAVKELHLIMIYQQMYQ